MTIDSVKEFFSDLWDNLWFQIVTYVLLIILLTSLVVYNSWRIDEQCYAEATEQEQYLCQKDHNCSCVKKASYDLNFKELQK